MTWVITKIDIILENVELITIDGKYIELVDFQDIQEDIITASDVFGECIQDERKKAGYVGLTLKKEADKYYATYNGMPKMTVFERLQAYQDIVSIVVYSRDLDTDEIKKVIYDVSWEFAVQDEINQGQQTEILDNGSLSIEIS